MTTEQQPSDTPITQKFSDSSIRIPPLALATIERMERALRKAKADLEAIPGNRHRLCGTAKHSCSCRALTAITEALQ